MTPTTDHRPASTRTCKVCGEPLARWEDTIHLACHEDGDDLKSVMDRIGIPPLFQPIIANKQVDLDKVPIQLAELLKDIDWNEWRGNVFVGEAGTGKTLLAAYMATIFVSRGIGSARYVNLPKYLLDIKESFNKRDDMHRERYGFPDHDLLILDDIGAEHATDFVREQLYIIVNNRYTNPDKRLVVTTNLSIQRLAETIGDRITSRLVGMCTKINFGNKDRRLE